MPRAWLPGVERIHAATDGGTLTGGAPRAVWHTTGTDPRRTSAFAAAWDLDELGATPHLVWNPVTGAIVQLIPATRAGRTLRDRAGGLAANREGRLCVQIAVVGLAGEPGAGAPLHGLGEIMCWLDSWDVSRRDPAGGASGTADGRDGERLRARWSRGGHFAHAQVPGSTRTAPCAPDISTLLA